MGRRGLAQEPWQYQAVSIQHVLPSSSRRLQLRGGVGRECVCMGPLQEQQPRSGASAAGPTAVAQPKTAKLGRRGPGLSRRKTSQGLQIAALSCPPTPAPSPAGGGKKKKTVLPLEADANGCRILTISCINQAFPKQSLPGTRQRHHGKGVVGSLHAFSVRYWEAEASSASLTRARVWSTAEGVALGAYCLVPAQA